MAYDIFMLSGVLEELAIPESELTGFLSAVSAHYHSPEDVPYHNLSHVVQVLHAVWLVRMAADRLMAGAHRGWLVVLLVVQFVCLDEACSC